MKGTWQILSNSAPVRSSFKQSTKQFNCILICLKSAKSPWMLSYLFEFVIYLCRIKPIKISTKGIHNDHSFWPTARDSFLPMLVAPRIHYREIRRTPWPLFSLALPPEIALCPGFCKLPFVEISEFRLVPYLSEAATCFSVNV